MRKLITPWSIVVVVLPVAVLPAWAGQAGPSEQAVDALRAEIPLVKLYEEGSRITRVYGQPLAFGMTAEDSAEQFLLTHAGVFGVQRDDLVLTGFPGGDDLIQPVMFEQTTGDYKFYLLRYTQYAGDIPVFRADARLLVRNVEDFPLVLVASGLRDLGGFTPPSGAQELEADRVLAAATAAVPGLSSFTEPRKVIWAGLDDMVVEPAVAWTFEGDNYGSPDAGQPEKWLFVVDARSGAILYQENRILFTDVFGNVSGNATEGKAAEQCEDEVPTAMPYARVNIGSTVAYADENGDYVIPWGGSSEVTVESRMRGEWFQVNNWAGADTVLSETVTPPGPADFLHNPDNTPLVRSQVNGYLQANIIRDFVLTYNPAYPRLGERDFPVYVNRTDGYCPCNAWYDYESVNFCQSGSSCPNTAFSTVIYHEYGHHLVQVAGSGQGEYGEGMGDVMGVLITDDSGLAYGFYGGCSTPLRDADNDIQYPCSGEIHYCGQLISGCVWSTRNELAAVYPDEYMDILAGLAINAMLEHTGSSITPAIAIDYLTLDDTDGDIYNGTPHGQEICAGFAAHNMADICDEITFAPIGFQYPAGRPEWVRPGEQTTIAVNVVPLTGTPVSGTGQVHYSLDGGSWVTEDMTEGAPNEYEAVLPAASCGSSFEWYVSAEALGEGRITDPFEAPTDVFFAPVATEEVVIFEDDFEADLGWEVFAGADTGNWERADPERVTSTTAGETQPEDDHTPDGTLCYVTEARAGSGAGSFDVDGGPSRLTSPAFDLTGTDGTVSYWRWFHISTQWNDELLVEVSNDDGAHWVEVESIRDRETWTYVEWNVSDFVTPTAQVRVRFTVDDTPNDSLVEALVDDFTVSALVCEDCVGDLDGDGSIGLSDLAILLANYPTDSGAQPEDGDLDGDGDIDLSDLAALLAVYGTDCP